MTGIIELIVLIVTILFTYGKWRLSKEKIREKKDEEFNKAIVKDDHESMSGGLSDSFDKLREKNRDRSR